MIPEWRRTTLTNLVVNCKVCRRQERIFHDVLALPPGWVRQTFEGRDGVVLCGDCAQPEHGCYDVRTKAGNVARVHGDLDPSSESAKAIEDIIDAACKYFPKRA